MASKSTKQVKKDTVKDDKLAPHAEFSMAALTSLLEDHRKGLATEFKTALTSLETKLDSVQAAVLDQSKRITSLESNADFLSEKIRSLEVCSELTETFAKLKAKMSDLEGRSRRNNIRIVGVPESVEGPRPSAFFSQLLMDVLGEQTLSSPPEIDRAYRAPMAKPKQGGRPRAVIVRFHRYQIKEAVIREARKRRGSLQYQHEPIAIYDDYSPEVMEQRAQYREVMAELYKQGLKPSLLFPARLRIIIKEGGQKSFTSVKEAENFLKTYCNT